jgi:hypothetical protein
MIVDQNEEYSMSGDDSLSSSTRQMNQRVALLTSGGEDDEDGDDYAAAMESGNLEKIDPTIHFLEDVLQDDFYKTYKHDKMTDMPSEFIDRFHELRGEIFGITNRKSLEFRRLKQMIAKLFPRGKKDTKTKERVDEIIARVYTEATRRMMQLMLDEGDTSILKIDPERFAAIHPDFASLQQTRPEEFKNIQLFYRAIYIAHRVIGVPCQGFRSHFMRIGTLLENSGIYYATGGRPAKTTMARKELIDKLTQCRRTKRITNKKLSPSPSNNGVGSAVDNSQGLLALLEAAENVGPALDPAADHTATITDESLSPMMKLEPFNFEYQNMEHMNEIVDDKRRKEENELTGIVNNTLQLGLSHFAPVDYTSLLNQPDR